MKYKLTLGAKAKNVFALPVSLKGGAVELKSYLKVNASLDITEQEFSVAIARGLGAMIEADLISLERVGEVVPAEVVTKAEVPAPAPVAPAPVVPAPEIPAPVVVETVPVVDVPAEVAKPVEMQEPAESTESPESSESEDKPKSKRRKN